MKFEKKIIAKLNKCYSIAPLNCKNSINFLVAAEKHDPCFLFDEAGNYKETVWDAPGGVMTMVQIAGNEKQFLATHQFYSPNDSAKAKIVVATKTAQNGWEIRTLVEAPFVHRFGILERNGVQYLLVCCLKSDHKYKDDWTTPGAVYAAVLPKDLGSFSEENQLRLTRIKDNMCHNHGYSTYYDNGVQTAIVSSDEGVFQFVPPADADAMWDVRQLYNQPVSDAVLCDFDQDGQPELGCIAPFHGDQLYICKKNRNGIYEKVWQHAEALEMLHATWACEIKSKPVWFVGHRKGTRDLMVISWQEDQYHTEVIDRDCGSANVFHFVNKDGCDILISANREIDEIAMYFITE